MDGSKDKGVNMGIEDKNKLRHEKLKFLVYNLKRNWKIFYSSRYGKIGFYILLGFIIISLISPLIIEHNNPLTYTAPPEDYFVPQELIHSSIPLKDGTVIQTGATNSGSDSGSYLVYYITSTGLYGIFTSNGTVINLLSVHGLKNIITVAISSPSSSIDTYVLLTANTSIYEGYIVWSSGIPGSGTPLYQYSQGTVNGTISSPPVSNAITYHSDLGSAFAYACTDYHPALVSVIVKNSSNYYLDTYYIDGLDHKSSVKLPDDYNYNGKISYYSACFVSDDEEIFLVNGNSLLGYSPFNGNLETNISFSSTPTEIYIPHGNNEIIHPNNSIYVSSTNKIYRVDIASSVNNKSYSPNCIYSSGSQEILRFSTSAGSSGNPSYYAVSLGDNHILILNSKYGTIENVTDSSGITEINSVGSHFMLANANGYIAYLVYLTSSNPYGWATLLHKSINNTVNFLNPQTAKEAFITFNGTNFVVYSTSGKDINPLPPTFHTVSGNIYPLGTTATGKDVWSEFIGSFSSDLYIGILVGIGVMLIALLVGMVIGYYSGIISSGIETFALAIFLIPGLPLLIVVASIVGPSLSGIIAILILLSWPFGAFTLIGMVRSIKSRTFIDAAITSGAGTLGILKNHMVKNVMPILIYQTAVGIGGAVAAISTLQILGIAPLNIPTWGGMLADFFKNYYLLLEAPWWFIPPIVAITLFIIAFIFISKGMDRIANPRAGVRR